jgi:Tol biopolymer transport system component
VNSSEKHTKTPFRRTGAVAVLCGLPGGGGSGAPSRIGVSLFGVLVVLMALMASSANAAVVPRSSLGLFGSAAQPSFGDAAGMAIDPSDGDLYVIDLEDQTLRRFKPNGEPDAFSALSGSNEINGHAGASDEIPVAEGRQEILSTEIAGNPIEAQVAVAPPSAAGDTAGDVYVTDALNGRIVIFESTGKYLGQLKLSKGYSCGVAVDGSGDVYVDDYYNGVHKFLPSANGSPPSPTTYAETAEFSFPTACQIAAGTVPVASGGSEGFIFVTHYGSSVGKLDSTTGAEAYQVDEGGNSTVAVDPVTGHVYVAPSEKTEEEPEVIREYDVSGASGATLTSTIHLPNLARGVTAGGTADDIYVTQESAPNISVFGPVPDVITDPGASAITRFTATLNGSVDPDGVPLQPSEGCYFEYGPTEAYGQVAPCTQSSAEIGEGSGAVPVDAELSGLTAFSTYHFRLVATNVNGGAQGADQTFKTAVPPPPAATTDGVGAGPEPDLMTLEGRLDPNGFAVGECRFLYGTTTEYGESTPCVPAAATLGSGNGDVSVTATTEPLDPNTTYHYRLQASNPGGTAQGEDRTFTTGAAAPDSCPNAAIRAEQGAKALQLPDCMALEMVSPAVKNQQYAREPSVSADGDRVLFTSSATIGGTPLRIKVGGDLYVASRGPSGWQTSSTSPPPAFLQKEPEEPEVASLSPDFSHWALLAGTGGKPVSGVAQAFESGLGDALSPISPVLTPLSGPGGLVIRDSSADRSHFYLQTSALQNAEEIAAGKSGILTTYLSGDPEPEGATAESNTYVAGLDPGGRPSLALLARDRDGKAWGGECGARLGGIESQQIGGYLADGLRSQGAVSPDGRRVYFSTRPDQPAAGPCLETSKMRIMVREETATGPKIEELFQSECDRVAPACSAAEGDDSYQGASVDQTRVYFTTNRQLVDTDRDGSSTSCSNQTGVPGCDLYVYDSTKPAGERLTQVSAGDASDPTPGEGADVVSGITAISADGSHVYFVADGVLTKHKNSEGAEAQEGQPNLYAYTYPAKELAFVGTLSPADGAVGESLFGGGSTWENGAYPVPIMGTDAQGRQIGGDGHILLFRSKAALTAGDTNGAADIFRYDADSGSLERISAPEPGGSDSGSFDATTAHGSGLSGPAFAVIGRWVSEDGQTVVFRTAQPLVPGDVNGLADSYMWRDGKLFRLPGTAESELSPTLSPDGSTVAFTSGEVKLLPGDGDGAPDVYVARVDGGYPPPAPAPACAGEEGCQGAPATSPGQIGAASSTFAGTGNPKASPRRPKCHKGKAHRHGRCVKRQTEKKHHKKLHHKEKHHRRPHRSAGHGHGDSR